MKAPPRTGEPGTKPWMLGRWFASSSAQFCAGSQGGAFGSDVSFFNAGRENVGGENWHWRAIQQQICPGYGRSGVTGAHRHACHRCLFPELFFTVRSNAWWDDGDARGSVEARVVRTGILGKSALSSFPGAQFRAEDARVVTRRGCGFGGFRVRREPGKVRILTLSTTDQPSAGAGRYHPPLRSGLDGSEARLFR